MYVIDDLNWDMILGKRWMEDQDVHTHAKEGYLEIGSNGVQYHKWSRAFSQQLADQLPPHRPGVDLRIEVLKDEHGREKPLPWGPLYSMSREELLVLRKTLTELLDKGFIRVSSSPAAAPVLMRDRYPLPLLSETLRTIAKARWFTKDYLDDFVSAYIDDVLIFSSGSLQDHRDKVGKVLQRLMDAGLQLDINKSEFEVKAVKYLGFIIEAECGIRVDPEKVEAVKGWATPTNIKSDVPFRWDGLCEEAFEKLKDLLITAPILHTSIQKGRLSWKRTLQDSPEANYAIHDKELLAILRCLEQWEPELRAVEHFKILTDHKNLRYFYSERRLTERQVRWSEFLSKFQFKLEWRPGRKGGLPDALSRRDQDMPANYSDERLKGRIMRLFQDDHLRRVPISTLSTNTEGAQEINVGKEIRIFVTRLKLQRGENVGQQAEPTTSNVAFNGAQGTQTELGEIRQQLDQQIDYSRRQGEQIQQLLSALLEKSGERGSRRRSRSPEYSPPPRQRIRERSPIYEPKNKNQVQIQQFRGTSAAELSTFVGTLQWVFREHPRHYQDEQRRIRLAAGHLSQTLRRDFLDNLRLKFDGSEENMTWGDMEDWLWSNINNPRGRTRNAYTSLTKLKQKPGQSFRDFFRQYRAIESEFPQTVPDWLRIEMFLFCCNKDIKDLFRSQNYPKSWTDLVEKGHEYDDDFHDKGYQPYRSAGDPRSTETNGEEDTSTRKEKPGACFKCGKPGHIRPKCTEPDCKRCGDGRHTTARHSDPATGPNGIRRVQQEPEDED
ncbi:reverse transcriptase (RNA-dependent DNA polymerase) domain-containing protein [Hirsutella rhossiliensis]|uniref:Reverse transcriptase (RNA-dependent DNA polymerase) domain-containing protein n=1 Tax=Hirsutella rhossiliensis TaxID=111463 RepID=A0A9P8SFX0_9HYPO|nr:reverse transcriptase (RNA-dependent DNA polymerase) domain-containing protein [Hirsutella rhossiliensis]KAH0959855.1 reverse transcriptase (RNA-dependent DNA polymerase) domain-containing protein [Hirsutella rhossiliensis]